MSKRLLHQDHDAVYFDETPVGTGGIRLRRHGDYLERLPGGYYRAHGRVDDTMDVSGIKVSSAEIERVCNTVEGVKESAAVAVPLQGSGPNDLIVFIVPHADTAPDETAFRDRLNQAVRSRLNPLFKIRKVEFLDALPRTASNKVMRRQLRSALTRKM